MYARMGMQQHRKDLSFVLDDPAGRCVGLKQSRKVIGAGKAEKVYIAFDADTAIKEEFKLLCESKNIPYTEKYSLDQLGEMCDIEVGAAVVTLYRR